MSRQNDCFVEYLEWESIKLPLAFSNIQCLNSAYDLPANTLFEVLRDNEYKLAGKISGVADANNNLEHFKNIAKHDGDFLEGDTIVGYDIQYTYKYEINDFFVAGSTFTPVSLPPDPKHSFHAEIMFTTITESHIHNPNPCDTILEFYLTSKTHFLYPRSTGRSKETRYTKRRGYIEFEEQPENILHRYRGTGGDYMHVEADGTNFIIQKIDSKFLPTWAHDIQIEYSNKKQAIPSEERRKGISEIVSFILGTHALKIGETWLDDNNNIIKRIAQSPWGDNVISKCDSNANPPFSSRWQDDRLYLEKTITDLVPTYLHLRDSLKLSDVLWKYWIAKELAIGTNLPILASAFETLAEDYIIANKLIKTYNQSEKKMYSNVIREERETLEAKLKEYEFKNRILNKLQNPFSLGMGEKIGLFAEALGLNITKNSLENEALLARNIMTHSSIPNDSVSAKKYIKLTHAYMSLFHRTILKILGHKGTYIDYATSGHPEKKITENLG